MVGLLEYQMLFLSQSYIHTDIRGEILEYFPQISCFVPFKDWAILPRKQKPSAPGWWD